MYNNNKEYIWKKKNIIGISLPTDLTYCGNSITVTIRAES